MKKVKFGLRYYSQQDVDSLREIASEKVSRILDRVQRYLDFEGELTIEDKFILR